MVYLDYNATTPVDGRVVESMLPVFERDFGNPSSANHDTGAKAANLVDEARQTIAYVVGMKPTDVIFTSGATEANNLTLQGLASGKDDPLNIVVGATEHKSVMEPCKVLKERGARITTIGVNSDGTIDLGALENALSNVDTDIVSIMAANSETGVLHPINKVAELAYKYRALFHCDATQAIGKVPFDGGELGIDMITLSSHKIYGPKGCGALVASKNARKKLQGMLYGGGQEDDLRSGTLNVPGIVGFGKACEIAWDEGSAESFRQAKLRDSFEEQIMRSISGVTINGKDAQRLPNTSNIRIAGVMAYAVIVNAKEVEISTGSACTSSAIEPSHVLTAMGLSSDEADESIRISVGRYTTQNDIDMAVRSITAAVQYVRGKEAEIVEGAGQC